MFSCYFLKEDPVQIINWICPATGKFEHVNAYEGPGI